MQKIPAIMCLLLGCLLSVPVFSQQIVKGTVFGDNEVLSTDSGEHYTLSLPIIVVTATRTPKLLKNVPILTKVITADEVKKVDATHIGELLQSELPGIEFSYSMNQQVSLNMQGFGGNSVLFLVDGERLAGETLDNIDYSRLNLDNVARIEIIKGAASTLYGSNALGGVVNIISKDAVDPWTATINSKLAAHNEQRHGGNVSFNTGRFSSLTNVQRTSIDSYEMANSGDYKEVFGSRTWNFKERLQYTLNDRMKLTGRAGYFFRERDLQITGKDRYRDFSGGIKGDYTINERNNLELAYSFDQYDKSDYFTETKNDIRDYSNVQHSIRGLYNHSFTPKNILTIGGDYMRDYLMSYQFKDNGNYRQHVADVFVQSDWTPFDKFNVITGLRYDYFSENKINRISPKAGFMYRVGRCSLRGSYAAGFRAPTLKEMYMDFDMAGVFMIYGNPDLKPETSHNFTLSTEYTNSYYNFSATGYYNLVENRITTAWSQALKGQLYANIDKITITGADVNASAKFPCGIGARFSYIYTHETIEKGQPLVSVTRPHTATARIEYGKSWKNYGFNLMLNGRFLSKVTADEYTGITSYEETMRVSYPAYTIWKLSLLQTIRKGINLTLAVDNLFNYVPSYYYFNSPYTTGATVSAGISLDIDKLFN
ncbi:MAG: TonB-dependent receptor [Tannerellaceae bacterium]|jgi:outer membrane receptor for ferrienterochelin and colicins|nr:TonB-dependent receptor [Tannerellaceae bacterium]